MVRQRFRQLFQEEPRLFWAPGRVNLIGEHTDYNDGLVMPAAIHLGCTVAAAPRNDGQLVIHSEQRDETVILELAELKPRNHWSDYAAGVAALLQEHGISLVGASLHLDSQVPVGAGLSSSAALEVSVGYALWSIHGGNVARTDLARYCQQAEHRFPGTQCGIMDQLISCHGQAGRLMMLDCRDLSFSYAPMPTGLKLVVCNSEVHHELATSAYNDRRNACHEAARLLGLPSLREATLEQVTQLPETLARRALHVVSENERVAEACEALAKSDLNRVGQLMAASHNSLRDDYQVSCSELDLLVDLARAHPATIGARMTGGGFGGCTVNLVKEEGVDDFKQAVSEGYQKATMRKPEIWVTHPEDGVHEVTNASH